MEELIRQLYSCRVCLNTFLKGEVGFPFPEPFLGNPNASFAIIGANPGVGSFDFNYWLRFFESDIKNYVNYYQNDAKISLESYKEWAKGYVEAFVTLVNPNSTVDLASKLDSFNKSAIILNIVKCATKKMPSKKVCELAKSNCLGYLIRQLEAIQPIIILSHSRFACKTIIEILKNSQTVVDDTSHKTLDTLARKMREGAPIMNEISKEYIIVKNRSGRKTLFLFNWHLSWYERALKSLENNIEQKKRIIEDLLQE